MAKIDPIVDIDINSLFFQLHSTALKEVEKTWKGKIDIINLGIDYKTQSFIGSGEFIIVAQHNEKDNSLSPKQFPDEFKEECKKALIEYCSIFAGKDAADKIANDDALLKTIDNQSPVPESIAALSLSQLLMEALTTNDNKRAAIGYYIEYNTSIEGQKKHRLYDIVSRSSGFLAKSTFNGLKAAVKSATSGLFGGVLKDIQSFKINIGGKDYNAGASIANALKSVADGAKDIVVIAGQKFKKAISKTNLEELSQAFEKELRADFPTTTANSMVYKVDSLVIKLRKQKKMTSEIVNKLMKNGLLFRMEYVIALQVKSNDENYEQFDIDSLHKNFTDAIKELKGLSALKDIPEINGIVKNFPKENILKIEGFKSQLGVNKIKKQSVSGESLKAKHQFMKLMLEAYMLVEDADVEKIKKQILALMYKDQDDKSKGLDDYKLKRLANKIKQLDDSAFTTFQTAKYDTKEKLAAALNDSIADSSQFDDIIKSFEDAGNLEELYDKITSLFNGKNTNRDATELIDEDLYVFCLPNVVRYKETTDRKKGK